MNFKTILIIFLLKSLLVVCQTPTKTSPCVPNRNIQILVSSGVNTENFHNYLKNNSIQTVKFVNDVQFLDKSKPYSFVPKLLQEEIARSYPNVSNNGIAYIDIEHPYLDYLMSEPINSEKFIKSKKLFLDVLNFAKKSRPNVKWGYYYLPFTSYWDRSDKFYSKNDAVAEIIKASDVLFPSIYMFYSNTTHGAENEKFLRENTYQSIKVAQKYNKPVYPFIMSRFHPSDPNVSNKDMDEKNFENYIRNIMCTTYNGKNIDGIVLWNHDDYSFRIKEKELMKDFSKTRRISFETFYENYLLNKIKIMQRN